MIIGVPAEVKPGESRVAMTPDGVRELTSLGHRVLVEHARQGGLGVLTFDEQADNWRLALARVRAIVEKWGIAFPAIPELDLDGVDVGDIGPEDIIPVF